MPVTYVNIEWPNKETDQVYSPSSVVKEYFNSGETLTVQEFLNTCNQSLDIASERVREKFGYACTSAQSESQRIEEKCKNFTALEHVKIISIK